MTDQPSDTEPVPEASTEPPPDEAVVLTLPATTAPEESAEDLAEFGPRYTLKDVRQIRAIRSFLLKGKIGEACKAAGVSYSAWYRWMQDPEFVRAFEHAKLMLTDELEVIALDRAKEGSDVLLQFLLKAHNPKYRDRQTITVVSADVQSRLERQAEAIMETCRMELGKEVGARLSSKLANRLREIWA